MAYSLTDKLVIGITSRALFELDTAHHVFEEQGLEAYREYQQKREDKPLAPGTGFALVKGLLALNRRLDEHAVEVVLISRNDADSGLRILNSIEHHQLEITRSAFTDGSASHAYLHPFCCDLFLSAHAADVRSALASGVAAGLVFPPPETVRDGKAPAADEVRIAFDGDAVIFSDESEKVFAREEIDGFRQHECDNEDTPLSPGPFKGFLGKLSAIQSRFRDEECPIRTALVTARDAPSHKRPIKTLRSWGLRVNESFFLGGLKKADFLNTFKPHIFFDDQTTHINPAAAETPSALVPPEAIEDH
ncbi:5'-nucleotidase [Candidatus Sumerlaeota bacterium]